MSKFTSPQPKIKNYWLEKDIELDQDHRRNTDGTEFVWKLNGRVQIFEPLIRETAYFGVDLRRSVPPTSPLDEGEIVTRCIEGVYDQNMAESWLFIHLYNHAIHQANAIAILFETSCIREGLQLWRSLFEAYAICEFFAKNRCEHPQLPQDYVCHSLLRSWIRQKEDYNALCKEKGREPNYDESDISQMKSMFGLDPVSWMEPRSLPRIPLCCLCRSHS